MRRFDQIETKVDQLVAHLSAPTAACADGECDFVTWTVPGFLVCMKCGGLAADPTPRGQD